LFKNAIIWVLIDQKMKGTNVVIMFKTRIGFYDYHATRQIADRSARFAFSWETTANKSAKTDNYGLG
jgi:hypothetical protein